MEISDSNLQKKGCVIKINPNIVSSNYHLVVFPILLTFLFVLMVFRDKNNWSRFSFFLLVIFISLWPIQSNIKAMVIQSVNHEDFQKTVYPLIEIRDNLCANPSSQILIEQSTLTKGPLAILQNGDEVFIMFNIISDMNLERENFILTSSLEFISKKLSSKNIECLLLEKSSYLTLQNQAHLNKIIASSYVNIEAPDVDAILLRRIKE